jgi:carbamoyltransferase
MIVLGLHGGVTVNQHEPSAALAVDGEIVAVCEEERYLRVKSCYGLLPERSIHACLSQAGVTWGDVDLVVTPGITYDDFEARMHDWLRHLFGSCPPIERVHHQMAHLATAYHGSGFDDALCLALDASGDGACGMVGRGSGGSLQVTDTIPNDNSLGMFYTLLTHYLGFTDGDEYKVMGLAPFGRPSIDLSAIVRPEPGGWRFDPSFLRSNPRPRSPFEPLYGPRLVELLGRPNRRPQDPFEDFHRDLARSAQGQFEDCLLSLAKSMRAATPSVRKLCFAGGLALNCVANSRLLASGLFDDIYVPPVASDRGLAVGCAYMGAAMQGDRPKPLSGAWLGSKYGDDAIRAELTANGVPFVAVDDPAEACAELLAEGRIVGWHQGRSEAGARALGSRSILAPCGDAATRDKVNASIKYREEFRPFAPSILEDRAGDYFDTMGVSRFPTMSFALPARPGVAERIRAVVHVDGTSRVQTVGPGDQATYHRMLQAYQARTGLPVVLNTSFNLKGQPIVETPRDALMTFWGCGMEALVIGGFVVRKPLS